MFNRILHKIADSLNGDTNNPSSIRIQSYLIIFPILLMIVIFLFIELYSFFHAIHHGLHYELSNEIIIVFGMCLSHHLAILFQRNKIQSISEIKGQ